jgi:hypothetical protein
MKRIIALTAALLLGQVLAGQETIRFPDDLVYDPFYAMKVTDRDANEYTLFNSFYQTMEGEVKYFVWFRRGTQQGLAEYPLDLYKIRKLTLTGGYNIPPDGFTPCQVELTSGGVFDGYLDTSGFFAGMDQDFGTFSRIYLQYNGIRSVEFIHNGRYQRCPFCGAIFYNDTYEDCPFDGTPLDRQNEN